ncbi:MAG: hypothetical protein EAZ19_10880 [Oscillatoriales cyanobacterium]|nr:MAG: hypothetical protein EAZ33_17405 [Oscillatoriales cyanobacterium]TAG54736.1 MAG: hypothetical protein EAZ28_24240 [Oscillatoriales cyanobacterium]TAG95682.1 MAG: hypothetical protein EAZ19_10880 [Oscillatoriales cyanobacterium]
MQVLQKKDLHSERSNRKAKQNCDRANQKRFSIQHACCVNRHRHPAQGGASIKREVFSWRDRPFLLKIAVSS